MHLDLETLSQPENCWLGWKIVMDCHLTAGPFAAPCHEGLVNGVQGLAHCSFISSMKLLCQLVDLIHNTGVVHSLFPFSRCRPHPVAAAHLHTAHLVQVRVHMVLQEPHLWLGLHSEQGFHVLARLGRIGSIEPSGIAQEIAAEGRKLVLVMVQVACNHRPALRGAANQQVEDCLELVLIQLPLAQKSGPAMQLFHHRAQAGLCVPLLRVEPALRFERHDVGQLESKAQDRWALPAPIHGSSRSSSQSSAKQHFDQPSNSSAAAKHDRGAAQRGESCPTHSRDPSRHRSSARTQRHWLSCSLSLGPGYCWPASTWNLDDVASDLPPKLGCINKCGRYIRI